MEWSLCASSTVSVAMRLESMGYDLHGHDVEVTACYCYGEGEARDDLEAIGAALDSALSRANRRPLWEVTGREGTLEDLLEYVARSLSASGLRGRLCYLRARVPGREVELRL